MTDIVYPIAAIRDDGATIVAHTPDEAIGFRSLHPGVKHRHHYDIHVIRSGGVTIETQIDRCEWIVRDDFGAVVDIHDLPSGDRRRGWYQTRIEMAQEAAARGLPIPRTGKRSRYRRGFRAFAKNMAMRAAEAALDGDLDDWGIAHMNVGRRRVGTLPKVCDDVAWRSGRRSWKYSRDTQWR